METIDPFQVRFSQSSVRGRFQERGPLAGMTIDDLAERLREGTIVPDDIEPIRVVEYRGKWFSLDNRRLEAFRRANRPIPYRLVAMGDVEVEFRMKFTTTDEGATIRVR